MKEKAVNFKHHICLWTIAALLALAGCICMPRMLPLADQELIFTNSIFSVAVFGVLLSLLHRALDRLLPGEKRKWLIAGLFSFLFSICMIFGASLEEAENVMFTDASMWMAIVVCSVIMTLLVSLAWEVIKNMKITTGLARAGKWDEISDLRQMLYMAGFILLCWLPVFLAVYPGFFVYDAQEEYMQVVTRNFSNHHPLIHVLLLGGIIQAGYKISGSVNLGIACYTIFQMVILAGIFSYGITYMKQKKVSLRVRMIALAYFGFFPVIVMFSLCSAKDGLFTGMLLLLFLMIKELCGEPETLLSSKGKLLLFIVGAVGVMMLRHNGKYAFWVFALVLLLYCREQRKKVFFLTAVSVGIYLVLSSGLSVIFGAERGGQQEMLTVPIQQVARVYTSEQETLNQEELDDLYDFLPEEALKRYTPKVSDSVKIEFNNEAFRSDPMKFLKLWGKWGISHPFTYLNAWLMTSYGFWYPDTVIDVYRGNTVFTYTYEDSSYFGYEVEEPGSRESKISWLAEGYRRLSLEVTQQKIPVISMLFSPGFLFWVMMFVAGYLWEQKKYRQLIPYLLPILIWMTVILGPTYLVRYVVFLWALLPFMIISLFDRSDGQ